MWPVPFANREGEPGLYERPNLPILLSPDGEFDLDLNSYWSDSLAALLAQGSLLLYARHLARFLTFIWHERSPGAGHRSWRDVDEDDRRAYHYWRNSDPNGPRVASSTWNNEVIAINRFYEYQVAVGNMAASPIRKTWKVRQHPEPGRVRERIAGIAELRRPKRPHASWFTPKEYRTWKDVGVRGYLPTGLRDPDFRGEQAARNAVFVDLMFGTGLRLQEQASLLIMELPAADGTSVHSRLDVAASVAKNESARYVLVAQRSVRAVLTYIETDRADGVELAQASGAYSNINDKILVNADGVYENKNGIRSKALEATPREREQLFKLTEEGFEPLALWLTRTGMPMRGSTWQGIFADANRRTARFGVELRCNAHKLRHSWATMTLAQLQRRYNHYRSGVPEGTEIGDPLNWVSRRLGHRRIETTMI